MLRLVVDEDFDNGILRGLLRRLPGLDVVRAQDVGLSGAEDSSILDWAAREGRVLLTHDVSTMTTYAYERIGAGLPMPGVLEISQSLALGRAIDAIVLVIECSREGEWEAQVVHLPL